MYKRITQALTVFSCMIACMCFASHNTEINTMPIKDVPVIISETFSEPVTISEPIAKNMVSCSDGKKNTGKRMLEAIAEPEPSYYVDIVNGYITEDSLRSVCEKVANEYDDISPELLQAMAWVESSYKVKATSHCDAKGLCQVMEKWNRDRMERLGVSDLYDPYGSVLICADIISELKSLKYGDDIRYVLMAYNMGATGAREPYESGYISGYAMKVLDKTYELEHEHGN